MENRMEGKSEYKEERPTGIRNFKIDLRSTIAVDNEAVPTQLLMSC